MGLAVNSIEDEDEAKTGNYISPPLPFLTCSIHDHLRAALPPPAVARQCYRVSMPKNHRLGGLSQFPRHGSMTVDNCRAGDVAAEQNQSSSLVLRDELEVSIPSPRENTSNWRDNSPPYPSCRALARLLDLSFLTSGVPYHLGAPFLPSTAQNRHC